ncbi:MAG TPA: hypothetical protein VLW65_01425 [Bryobacteraceae bacterium]|nr:hypothetical protein [Bryobacteraceae bacterium]
MERITRIDRTGAVAAAAAHDWNEELTVILSSIDSLLETVTASGPARQILLELRGAAQRCAWKSSGLLNFAARRGARPSAASMESLIT